MKKLKYRTSHFEPKQMLINYVQLLFFFKLLLKYYIILIKDGFHTAHCTCYARSLYNNIMRTKMGLLVV